MSYNSTPLGIMKYKFYLLFLVIILIYSLSLTGDLSTSGDAANYIILAKSLASGQGFRLINHPNQPPDTTYPPLLPFLLISLVKFFPENYLILKLIPLFFSFATVLILVHIMKILLPKKEQAISLVILASISPIIVYYSTQVLSESLYSFLSIFTLYLALRFDTSKDRRILLALPIAAAAAYYSRSIGISLIVSIAFLFLIRKRFKIFFSLSFIMLILISPWIIRNSMLSESSYTSSLFLVNPYDLDAGTITVFGFIKRFIMNIVRYSGKIIPNLLAYPWFEKVSPYNPFKITFGLIVSFLMLFGFYRNLKTKINLLHLYILVFFLICFIWPWYDTRFLLPILPFILLFLMQGIAEVIKLIKIKLLENFLSKKYVPHVIIGLVILFFLIGDGIIIYRNQWGELSPEWRDYQKACLWLKEHSEKGSNVLCRKPRYTYLISERKAVGYPPTLNQAKMSQFLLDHRIDYIIYDRLIAPTDLAQRFLMPFIFSRPEIFRPVYQAGKSGTTVFKWIGANKSNLGYTP